MNHTADDVFGTDHFRREQVMQRLRKQAVKLWGLPEAETDSFDPVIDLLLGACAVEFERTGQQIHASQSRVLQRLAQLMVPEVIAGARPAHAVMHAVADVPVTTLRAEDQFAAGKDAYEGNVATTRQVYLSPAAGFTLFDAQVCWQAAGNKLVRYESPVSKAAARPALAGTALPDACLWLGLRLNAKVERLDGLSFFFDWKNDPAKPDYLQLLPLGRWTTGARALAVHGGLRPVHARSGLNDVVQTLEDQVLHHYQAQFVTVAESPAPLTLRKFPEAFGTVFGAETLKELKEELLWIEVSFPPGVAAKALADVYCAVNCFPVMNRRLNAASRPYSLAANLNIIPLSPEEHFLAVRRIYAAGHDYHSVSVDTIHSMQEGSYAVRQSGVNRFDQRDAAGMLQYLHELMRDESAAFKALGNYALNTEIKTLDQSLTRLKMYFLDRDTTQPPKCHLFLYTREPEDAWVEYWSTQGERANRLPTGKKADPLSDVSVQKAGLVLVTPTTGGKEPMDENEKLYAFRYALLTRSRIATAEDIKAACFAELGNKLQAVQVRKGVRKDRVSRSGFARTIDVLLAPAPGFAGMDWAAACGELQAVLERNKLFLTDIRVFTNSEADVYVDG